MSNTIRVVTTDTTTWITLDRPKALNAINTEMKNELLAALQECAESSMTGVVLRGSGRAFCAGADLTELSRQRDENDDVLRRLQRVELTQRLVRAIRNSTFASVAAINGVAAGGGISLALACDIVVMSEQARFVWAFGDRRLIPDGGLCDNLRDMLGSRRATSLLLRTSELGAEEAAALGLVDEVVSASDLDSRVEGIAERLSIVGQPTVALSKRALGPSTQSGTSIEAVSQTIALSGVQTTPGGDHRTNNVETNE